ncbi:uncharacterized protein LOC132558423 [Ylistrum balloti]|uniref:uncharacterized protein LOC132558423 n=1 Tax=Ylistrum balloti TaxID=509963 RepID=UPI002905EA7E|nr:uncharacterized protein LOC132558423 [Ylistrum balloti]
MASNKSLHSSTKGLKIALIGTTGTGKSTTGNTLIGGEMNKLKTSASRCSSTKTFSVTEIERFGTKLTVVDTPGILNTTMSQSELRSQFKERTQLTISEIDVFLLLMKIGERNIDNEDEKPFRFMKDLFGEECFTHTIVVFTGKEILEIDGYNIDKYVSELPDGCKTSVNSCKGGILAISNTSGNIAREQAAKDIITAVNNLVQNNGRLNLHKSSSKTSKMQNVKCCIAALSSFVAVLTTGKSWLRQLLHACTQVISTQNTFCSGTLLPNEIMGIGFEAAV